MKVLEPTVTTHNHLSSNREVVEHRPDEKQYRTKHNPGHRHTAVAEREQSSQCAEECAQTRDGDRLEFHSHMVAAVNGAGSERSVSKMSLAIS